MQKEDVKILNEIHKGSQMGILAFDDMMLKADDNLIVEAMDKARAQFLVFQEKVNFELTSRGEVPKEVSGLQKFTASTSINFSTMFDNSAQNLSEMVVKGNEMGESKLSEELNDLHGLSGRTRNLCLEFIDLQKKQKEEFSKYLS